MNDKLFFINLDIEPENRFDIERFMEFTDNYDVLTSSLLNDINTLPNGGVYTVQGEDGRPDNISYKVYGDVQYWWIIMMYNSLTDISQIITGMDLYYPSLADLEAYYFSLKSKQVIE